MFNKCKKKDIYQKYGYRNYEKDILSSLHDVLPNYGSKEEERSVSLLPKSNQINSFNKYNQAIQSSKQDIFEDPDPMFQQQYCKNSLEYFSLNSKLRQTCILLHESKTIKVLMYINIILFIILISLESTNNQPNGFINNSPLLDSFIRYYMIFLNIYFLFDLFTAVIAKGLTSDRNAYLSNPINTLNALLLIFVTIFQILYLVELISNHRYFLHIQHISAMAKQSFTNMFQIFAIIFYFLFIYALIGVQIWVGFLDCNNNNCFTNFDSILNAGVTLFVVQQIEGWTKINSMLTQHFFSMFYFWVFIIISVFFLQSLVVAVMLKNMKIIHGSIKEEQPVPSTNHKKMNNSSTHLYFGSLKNSQHRIRTMLSGKEDTEKLRQFFVRMLQNRWIQNFYNLLFLMNLILLSFNNSLVTNEDKIALINLAIICAYLFEDLIRMYSWQEKDSKLFLIMEFFIDSISLYFQAIDLTKPFILNVIKGQRLIWCFKDQTNWSNYRVLLSALKKSLSTLISLILLLIVDLIISTITGRWLFAGRLYFKPRANFDTLQQAFTTAFQILCLDQWDQIFYNTLKVESVSPYIYFICNYILGRFLLVSVFLTVMLNQYDEAKEEAEKSRQKVELIISKFSKNYYRRNTAQIMPLKRGVFTQNWDAEDNSEENENNQMYQRNGSKIFQNYERATTIKDQQEENFNCQKFMDRRKQSSCFMLYKNSKIRRFLIMGLQHKVYEFLILVIILGSVVFLIFDNRESDEYKYIRYTFSTLFILEALFKVLAFGFLFGTEKNKAYLKNNWNLMDFIILVGSSIDDFDIYNSSYLRSLKALRGLRMLLPLRKVSQNEQLILIANSLFQTIPLLASMIFVSGVTLWIISIFTMSFWKGYLNYCVNVEDINLVDKKEDCIKLGGDWVNPQPNFDNIQNSLMGIFQIILGEGWSELMYLVSDIREQDLHPKPNHSAQNLILFYFLLFLCNILFYNLFVGLIINNYRTIRENIDNYKTLNEQQKELLQMQNIMQRKQLITMVQKPESDLGKKCYCIVRHKYFEFWPLFTIFLNLLFYALIFKDLDRDSRDSFTIIHFLLLSLFHIETLIKLLALNFFYFKEFWNRFDIFLLISTDILIILYYNLNIPEYYCIPIIIRGLRLIKLNDDFKLPKSIKVLINVIQQVFPTLINLVALIFLMIFIYALIAIQIFQSYTIPTQPYYYPYYQANKSTHTLNFNSFPNSILLLLQISTGQTWPYYMYQYANFTIFSYFYFTSFLILIRIIMLSLFVAMLIESYSDAIMENSAVINPFQLEDFLIKWSDYDPQGSGWITPTDFAFLMFELSPPLGFKDENATYQFEFTKNNQNKAHLINHKKKMVLYKKDIFKHLKSFNVMIYTNNMIHFKDVCIQIAHNAVCRKHKLDGIEISDKKVVARLQKSWESQYPDLTDILIKKNQGQEMYAVDLFAISSINNILKTALERRKIKKRIMEYQLQNKLKNLAMSDATFFPNLGNVRERTHNRHSKRKSTRRMIFQYSQNQRQGTYFENKEDEQQAEKRVGWDNLPREKKRIRRNSLESHNFKIQLSELNQGFPMKVIFETQKIDFNDNEKLKMWENEAQIMSPQDSVARINLIPSDMNINSEQINQISEREDEDEEAEDEEEGKTQTKYQKND